MQKYATISVKIPIADREEMRKLKIKPSKVVRMAIRRRLKRERIERLKVLRKKMQGIFEKLPTQMVTASIREDRDSR